jgi:hypothetical protein
MLLSNPALQTRLIDFVQDAFIEELLIGITKYMMLCDQRDLQRHAFEKANSLLSQIKKLYEQSQQIKSVDVD